MDKPTQAQIEVKARMIFDRLTCIGDKCKSVEIDSCGCYSEIVMALTAAAGVARREVPFKHVEIENDTAAAGADGTDEEWDAYILDAKEALTGAVVVARREVPFKHVEIENDTAAAAGVGTFEAGPDELETGAALTKAIDAVIAEDEAAAAGVDAQALCELCGEPMPEGETMFKFHGYSGPCPKPPLREKQSPHTQAQIDAALNTFNHCMEQGRNRRQAITAALTAAAGVDAESDLEANRLYRYLNGLDQDSHDKRAEHVMHQSLDGLHVGPGNRNSTKEMLANHFQAIEADTIERCAQVADANGALVTALQIRALKDKP